MRSPGRRLVAPAVAAIAAVVLSVSGCASDATTVELADDPADVTVAGPRPTAPVIDVDSGLSASGDALLVELDALRNETDLCNVLSGSAFEQLLSQDFDVAGLVTSPAGVTQLIALIDGTFTQLVVIAPDEVAPAMQTIRDVWTRVASLNTGAPDAQARTAEILAEPQVIEAQQSLLRWAALNCDLSAG